MTTIFETSLPKRSRTNASQSRSASLKMTAAEAMPAASKLPSTWAIRGTPPTSIMGLGTPSSFRREPSPAAMTPPATMALIA